MKWINVNTELPMEGLDVLVYLPNCEKIIVAYYWKSVWLDTIPKPSDYYIVPSHWMLLPTIPTVKK